jgi:chloramphenicol 3-O phosphotransferase
MTTRMIFLNGGSSSGKSGIARCLQAVLPDPWLTFGVDTLVDAMPPAMRTPGTEGAEGATGGIAFGQDGEIVIGPAFRLLEAAWIEGLVAMARSGARVIVDEVLLSGGAGQQRWLNALSGARPVRALWVGVRCEGPVAAGREIARGDRIIGMATSQAELAHRGVRYDLEVDTTRTESLECARAIAAHLYAP